MSDDLRDHLQAIYDQHGHLKPNLVVQTARDPEHPLHSRFEWDDAVAAEAYRLEQAHGLITSVRIVYREADESGPERSVRAFHALRNEDGYVYEPVEKVLEDDFAKRLLLMDMEREWKAMYSRYKQFEEFLSMVRADLGGPS